MERKSLLQQEREAGREEGGQLGGAEQQERGRERSAGEALG